MGAALNMLGTREVNTRRWQKEGKTEQVMDGQHQRLDQDE